MMTEDYCPKNKLQKLEVEFWNLTVKGNDITGYTTHFHELALLCPTMVTLEYKKIERYIRGLMQEIHGNVTSSKLTTLQSAMRMAHDLMEQVVRTRAAKSDENKRK
ncbi:reverse transcriptase domain-containing protein [Tanacetum coccineum]